MRKKVLRRRETECGIGKPKGIAATSNQEGNHNATLK
jgi:hypothetical protein